MSEAAAAPPAGLDPLHLTMWTLNQKSLALGDSAMQLSGLLAGGFDHDGTIQQQAAAIVTERANINSRLAALATGSPFTAPTSNQIDALTKAINAVGTAVSDANKVVAVMKAATDLLNAYGPGASNNPPT